MVTSTGHVQLSPSYKGNMLGHIQTQSSMLKHTLGMVYKIMQQTIQPRLCHLNEFVNQYRPIIRKN